MKNPNIEWKPDPHGPFMRWQNTVIAAAKYRRLLATARSLLLLTLGFLTGGIIVYFNLSAWLFVAIPIFFLTCVYIVLAIKAFFNKFSIQQRTPPTIKYVPEGVDEGT